MVNRVNTCISAASGRARRAGGGHGVEGRRRRQKGKLAYLENNQQAVGPLNFWLGSLRRNSWEIKCQ